MAKDERDRRWQWGFPWACGKPTSTQLLLGPVFSEPGGAGAQAQSRLPSALLAGFNFQVTLRESTTRQSLLVIAGMALGQPPLCPSPLPFHFPFIFPPSVRVRRCLPSHLLTLPPRCKLGPELFPSFSPHPSSAILRSQLYSGVFLILFLIRSLVFVLSLFFPYQAIGTSVLFFLPGA